MPIERCDECGFDGATWSDAEAIEAVAGLPGRWARAVADVAAGDLQRRPIAGMWSIAEYTNHVRETAFGMRFVLDTVLATPGADLGDPPEALFDPVPRAIDTARALSGFESEIVQLCERLRGVSDEQWDSTCTIGGDDVDVHWIARHIVHDVTHHVGDVARLRRALNRSLRS